MSTNHLRITVASAVILVCVAFLYFWFGHFKVPFDAAPHKALGTVLAEEALKLRGGNGKVFAITRDTQTYANPATDVQLASFRSAIKKGGAEVAQVRFSKLAPIRVVSAPPGDFQDLMTKNTADDVIVSFVGPPVLSDAQFAAIGHKPPKIVALCSGWTPREVDLRKIFEQGALDLAVISREHPVRSGGGGPRGEFDQWFAIVTSQNASELPPVATSRP